VIISIYTPATLFADREDGIAGKGTERLAAAQYSGAEALSSMGWAAATKGTPATAVAGVC